VIFSEPGAEHSKKPWSLQAMHDFGVLEQDIVVAQFMRQCLAAGFSNVRLHPMSYALPDLNIDPDEWDQWNALVRRKQFPEAIEYYREVVHLRPNDSEAHRDLGKALLQGGAVEEGIVQLSEALRLRPRDSDAAFNLGNALLEKGDLDHAIDLFRKAIAANPNHFAAHYNQGIALQRKGLLVEAIAEFRQTLRLNPRNLDARKNLAIALLKNCQAREAVAEWREALRLQPDKLETEISLAWILATSPEAAIRDGDEALMLARHAETAGDRNPIIFRVLAAAYAEAGRFQEATAAARRGKEEAEAQGQYFMARYLQADLDLYEQRIPLRDPTGDCVEAAHP
jgi:tetratricopeptide (TPR) repeat protein